MKKIRIILAMLAGVALFNGVAVADYPSQDDCVNTGGEYDPETGKCKCDEKKNLKLTADGKRCECISDEYEWADATKTKCIKKKPAGTDTGDGTVRVDAEIDVALSIQAQKIQKQLRANKAALNDVLAKFDSSVWRDADGNFNTARLASDTIAGVVLGTAGGLVTSKVIKKNQIENGLDDVQCSIGGQVVGAFGDEFRVGIQ